MAYKPIVHELFNSIKTTLHERFEMIEEIIRIENEKVPVQSDNVSENIVQLSDKITSLTEAVEQLSARLATIEDKKTNETVHVTRIGTEVYTPVATKNLQSMFIESMKGLEIHSKTSANSLIDTVESDIEHVENEEVNVEEEETIEDEVVEEIVEEVVEEEVEEEVVEEEVVEEEVVEEVEEEVVEEVEEEVEEEEEEEEVEEDGIELEEFPYKGKVYYKDSENKLYKLDENGEPHPIGRFDPVNNKVLSLIHI